MPPYYPIVKETGLEQIQNGIQYIKRRYQNHLNNNNAIIFLSLFASNFQHFDFRCYLAAELPPPLF
jgi:hypothetical protein